MKASHQVEKGKYFMSKIKDLNIKPCSTDELVEKVKDATKVVGTKAIETAKDLGQSTLKAARKSKTCLGVAKRMQNALEKFQAGAEVTEEDPEKEKEPQL